MDYPNLSFSNEINLNFINRFEIQTRNDSNYHKIYLADSYGSEAVELIFTENNRFRIFSIEGKLLFDKTLPHSDFLPAFTYDMDGDEKKDMILGTRGAAKNEVLVLNGTGEIIALFKEHKTIHDFSAIIPQFVLNKNLYCIAQPKNKEAPRGILCLDLFNLSTNWMFYTPPPTGLTHFNSESAGDYLILSYQIDSSGLFLNYGKSNQDELPPESLGLGIEYYLMKISANGSAIDEVKIHLASQKLKDEILNFYPVYSDEDSCVMIKHITKNHNADSSYSIHRINIQTGKEISSSKQYETQFDDIRIASTVKNTRLFVSEHVNNNSRLVIYDSNLNMQKRIACGSTLKLGSVVMNNNSEANLLCLIENSLYLIKPDFSKELLISGDYVDLEYFTVNNKNYLILYDSYNQLEIFTF